MNTLIMEAYSKKKKNRKSHHGAQRSQQNKKKSTKKRLYRDDNRYGSKNRKEFDGALVAVPGAHNKILYESYSKKKRNRYSTEVPISADLDPDISHTSHVRIWVTTE